jgi:hypothetical protein
MRVAFDVSINCPHCDHGLDVPDRADNVFEITCIQCKRPSTFENATYKQWIEQAIRGIQTGVQASRFAHAQMLTPSYTPARTHDGSLICEHCGGKGTFGQRECYRCRGSGIIMEVEGEPVKPRANRPSRRR